jgi:thiol:disulfide interchange protein DsbC
MVPEPAGAIARAFPDAPAEHAPCWLNSLCQAATNAAIASSRRFSLQGTGADAASCRFGAPGSVAAGIARGSCGRAVPVVVLPGARRFDRRARGAWPIAGPQVPGSADGRLDRAGRAARWLLSGVTHAQQPAIRAALIRQSPLAGRLPEAPPSPTFSLIPFPAAAGTFEYCKEALTMFDEPTLPRLPDAAQRPRASAAARAAASVACLAALLAGGIAVAQPQGPGTPGRPSSAAKPAAAAPKPAAASSATDPSARAGTEEHALLERLKALYPTTSFSSVARTPLPGIYEVVMGANVAYVNGDGRYFLFGHLFDLQRQKELTGARQPGNATAAPAVAAVARLEPGVPAVPPQRVDLAQLPLRDAIVQSSGTGARKLVLFVDPHCPHCKRLDADLPQLADTTVYTFLVPLQGWESREAAQRQWVVNMPERALETSLVIDQNLRLARRLGISATPTMIRADGQVVQGALSLPELMAWLDGDTRMAGEPGRTQP